jgi:hypothetical protein
MKNNLKLEASRAEALAKAGADHRTPTQNPSRSRPVHRAPNRNNVAVPRLRDQEAFNKPKTRSKMPIF